MCRLLPMLVVAAALAGPAAAAAEAPWPTYDHPIVVDGTHIAREQLRHWERVAGRDDVAREQATIMLIEARWIRLEARRRGVRVTREQVRRQFRRHKRDAFPSHRAFKRWLRSSGQTRGDLLFRVRTDLTSDRLRAYATRGATTEEEEQAQLDAFVQEFRDHWLPRTRCSRMYFVETHCAPPA